MGVNIQAVTTREGIDDNVIEMANKFAEPLLSIAEEVVMERMGQARASRLPKYEMLNVAMDSADTLSACQKEKWAAAGLSGVILTYLEENLKCKLKEKMVEVIGALRAQGR